VVEVVTTLLVLKGQQEGRLTGTSKKASAMEDWAPSRTVVLSFLLIGIAILTW
jgi:hypothetical protein